MSTWDLPSEHATRDKITEIHVRKHWWENARDKFYAFCVLNEQWTNIIVDYKKSVLEVFLHTVQPGRFPMFPESIR